MTTTHRYELDLEWTGNLGPGTSSYRAYSRAHLVSAPTKAPIEGSSDHAFRGDAARWNPEELLVASLSQCHLLWYLDLSARSGVVVTGYTDHPVGTMAEDADGAGQFVAVVLRPAVTVADDAMREPAMALHDEVHAKCFIARSVSFPVRHEPTVATAR